MRSLVYFLFYESPVRTELSRNLLGVITKLRENLAAKLPLPYIKNAHLFEERHNMVTHKLVAELKAIHKRQVILELFRLTMPTVDDFEPIFEFLEKLEVMRNRHQDNVAAGKETDCAAELLSYGTDWLNWLFPQFDANAADETTYQEICAYVLAAFTAAAVDGGSSAAQKGLDLELLAFERLPKALQSVVQEEQYRKSYAQLMKSNLAYGSITHEVALSYYQNLKTFKNISLPNFINCYEMAETLTADFDENRIKLSDQICLALFNHGLFFIRRDRRQFVLEIFQRYAVITEVSATESSKTTKIGVINEHSLHIAMGFVSKLDDERRLLNFKLPPLQVSIKNKVRFEVGAQLKKLEEAVVPQEEIAQPKSPKEKTRAAVHSPIRVRSATTLKSSFSLSPLKLSVEEEQLGSDTHSAARP